MPPGKPGQWTAKSRHHLAGVLRSAVGVTKSAADGLVRQLDADGDFVFVAEVIVHSEASPRGYHAGATRWALRKDLRPGVAAPYALERLERDVAPRGGGRGDRERA